MQPKYNLNSKSSNLIQMNQEQKRKSRHRVIGSVTLLFIALVALLNVTSNVRPIAINPQVVEIKNTTSHAPSDIKISSSGTSAINESSSIINNEESITAHVLANNESKNQVIVNNNNQQINTQTVNNTQAGSNNNGFKAGVLSNKASVNANGQQASTNSIKQQNNPSTQAQPIINNNVQVATKPTPQPKATNKPKINPAAILDDVEDVGHNVVNEAEQKIDGKFYIQFAALSTQDKANKLQQDLAAHGVSATIQNIQTQKGTLFRLRAGPFSKETAQNKLNKLSADGFSGIITSK